MDRAVAGKRASETEMEIPMEDGFGPHDPGLTFTDDLENVPLNSGIWARPDAE